MAGVRVDPAEHRLGVLHTRQREEAVATGVHHQRRKRRAQAHDLGKIEVARQQGHEAHPRVRVALVQEEVAPGGHHADAHARADAVVEPREESGAQAAARQAHAAEPGRVDDLKGRTGQDLDAEAAGEAGLVTFTPDDIDWDDEVRIALEERAAFSPDALTGMEASLRFAGPETIESKIFARLSAWQNWIFQRPNAVGDRGALQVYGTGQRAEFDRRRV